MWIIFHYAIVTAYVLAPPAALAMGIFSARRKRRRWPVRRLFVAGVAGVLAGLLVNFIHALALQGTLKPSQVLLAAYLIAAMLILLHAIDHTVNRILCRLLRCPTDGGATIKAAAVFLIRAALIAAIGLPYILATALVYRPRVGLRTDPLRLLNWQYESVSFRAVDGVCLSGWWIPGVSTETAEAPVDRTVIVCPGLAQSRDDALRLARKLRPAGWNVLVFDFRGHGESSGQLVTMGDTERRDVLAAVRWLLDNHRPEADRIVGVGIGTGAAALLAAAVDNSREGNAIEAVAVIATFDRLSSAAISLSHEFLPGPIASYIVHASLLMASAQTGSNLSKFAPVECAEKLWPRPLLVIHGMGDPIVPFEQGQNLFDAAKQPKYNDWVERGGHDDVIESDSTASLLRWYFETARIWL